MNLASSRSSDTLRQHPPDAARSTNQFLTLSNLLSLARIVLILPFLAVVFSSLPSARWWACVIVALAALTDKLDGMFARKYQQATEWGRILDPLADKICISALVIVLLIFRWIPLWFAVAVFARDALILIGGLYLKARHGLVLPSNRTGKWAVGFIGATLFLLLVGVQSVLTDVMIVATTLMLAASLALYLKEFFTVTVKGVGTVHGPS